MWIGNSIMPSSIEPLDPSRSRGIATGLEEGPSVLERDVVIVTAHEHVVSTWGTVAMPRLLMPGQWTLN